LPPPADSGKNEAMRSSPFVILCTTGLFAIFSSTISKSPVLPLFASHMGADPSGVGLIASVSAFAGVLFSIPAGMLSDRLGKRSMLVVSSVIFATAPFLYLLAAKIWQLALVRFYHGLATAIFIPVAMALVSELFHGERAEKMGWFSTATLLGRFMAPLAGGAILGAMALRPAEGFRLVYVVCGLAGLTTFVMALRVPHIEVMPQRTEPWRETFSAFRSVLADRAILTTCLVEASILFAYGTFETFLPLYSISIGLTAYEVGILLSSQVITLALLKPVMGKFSDRRGRRPQIFAGTLIGAACTGLFSFFRSFMPLLVLSVAFGFSLSVITAATSAYVADLSGRGARGSAMGLLGSVMDIGHATGPIVSGVVASLFGYPKAFAGSSLVLLAVGLLFLAMVGIGEGQTRQDAS